MAKQGQHNDDAHDYDKSKGPNKPDKSVTITTGSYKKQETYKEQAAEGHATDRQAQADRNDWNPDTRDKPSIENSTRARDSDIGSAAENGSESNADKGTRGH